MNEIHGKFSNKNSRPLLTTSSLRCDLDIAHIIFIIFASDTTIPFHLEYNSSKNFKEAEYRGASTARNNDPNVRPFHSLNLRIEERRTTYSWDEILSRRVRALANTIVKWQYDQEKLTEVEHSLALLTDSEHVSLCS